MGKLGMLTRKEIAERYDVELSWVERATWAGKLPFTKYGAGSRALVLIAPKDFEAYIDSCRHPATNGPLARRDE